MISVPTILYVHRIFMVLANPTHDVRVPMRDRILTSPITTVHTQDIHGSRSPYVHVAGVSCVLLFSHALPPTTGSLRHTCDLTATRFVQVQLPQAAHNLLRCLCLTTNAFCPVCVCLSCSFIYSGHTWYARNASPRSWSWRSSTATPASNCCCACKLLGR